MRRYIMEVSSIDSYYPSSTNIEVNSTSSNSSVDSYSLPPAEPGVGENIDIIG